MKYGKALGPLLLAVGLASGCVRLNEPDHFICHTSSDCEDDERCAAETGRCVGKDYCDDNVYCVGGQHCEQSRCVLDECNEVNEVTACNGYLCDYGDCEESCLFPSECASGFHCDQARCVPGALVENGQNCSKNADCRSQKCCGRPSGSICAADCSSLLDGSCLTAADCVSGNCCPMPSGKLMCSSMLCSLVPECSSNADCSADKLCSGQKCVERAKLMENGEPCQGKENCLSSSCISGVCRGDASLRDDCLIDFDCEAGRVCCPNPSDKQEKTCSDSNRGCPGSVGDRCEVDSDCLDQDCIANFTGFCSKPCASDADCGVSPWGAQNACETNGLGNKICFPGCTSTTQCYDNIGTQYECYEGFDSPYKSCSQE